MSDDRFVDLFKLRRATLARAVESTDLGAIDEHLKVLHQLLETAEAETEKSKKPRP